MAQQRGHRMPAASDYAEGANLGLGSAVADPDATVTVRGVAPAVAEKVAGAGLSEMQSNSSLSGKVFATRFGDCALDPSDTQELVKNACRFSEKYALSGRFRR